MVIPTPPPNSSLSSSRHQPSRATRALLRAAVDDHNPRQSDVRIAYGEVISTSPLTVAFNGTETADAIEGVATLKTFTPAVADIIVMIKIGPAWVAIGAVE